MSESFECEPQKTTAVLYWSDLYWRRTGNVANRPGSLLNPARPNLHRNKEGSGGLIALLLISTYHKISQ